MRELNVIVGDALNALKTLEEKKYHCCVTSPPYYNLRDYGVDGQIGLEETPQEYVDRLVNVFREVRRVLRDDGTLWLNLGDSYCDSTRFECFGLKPKDIMGIPWRVAFALQADGWYLRQDIIWHKPNPMPESVKDRCTKAHEYIFLLSKSKNYYFDANAIAEKAIHAEKTRNALSNNSKAVKFNFNNYTEQGANKRGYRVRHIKNRRSVWTISTSQTTEAHFAVFPLKLARLCILAGCPLYGNVLDPFGGSGTTALVALQENRNATLIEINPVYAKLAEKKLAQISVNLPLQ